ncbi:MAG: hypothetical protein KAS12_01570 [Candidatus Aenigmarchaeota archaeon]|nr:hypothetical protein [Candidatus Aenigmarchaeota archaeon]
MSKQLPSAPQLPASAVQVLPATHRDNISTVAKPPTYTIKTLRSARALHQRELDIAKRSRKSFHGIADLHGKAFADNQVILTVDRFVDPCITYSIEFLNSETETFPLSKLSHFLEKSESNFIINITNTSSVEFDCRVHYSIKSCSIIE